MPNRNTITNGKNSTYWNRWSRKLHPKRWLTKKNRETKTGGKEKKQDLAKGEQKAKVNKKGEDMTEKQKSNVRKFVGKKKKIENY